MESLSLIPLIVVAGAAMYAGLTDLRNFSVPNRLTFPLLLTGIVFHATVSGLPGLRGSLLGAALGFGLLIVLYVFGAMGAADVKLLMGVGAWLGVGPTLLVFIIAALGTGIYSLVLLSWQGGWRRVVTSVQVAWFQMTAMARHLGPDERVEAVVARDDRRRRLAPFAVMVAVGVVLMLIGSVVLVP